jgi:uncharacterized membrane protein
MAELIVLRLVHILGAILWLGSGLFTTYFLLPAMTKAGPAAAGPVMANLQQRRLYTVLPIVALLTILSGIRLMMIVSAGNPQWFASPMGRTYSISGAFAIVSFLTTIIIGRPATVRMGKLSQTPASGGASTEARAAEIRSLQKRVTWSTQTAIGLLILAAVGMAVARYM